MFNPIELVEESSLTRIKIYKKSGMYYLVRNSVIIYSTSSKLVAVSRMVTY